MKLLYFVATVFLLGTQALTQPPPPKVTLNLENKSPKAGEVIACRIDITIPAGYHAYANPPTADYHIPLSVKRVSGAELKSVKYPPGKTIEFAGEPAAAYEGTVTVQAKLVLPKKVHSQHSISVVVGYQLCDDKACFAPGEVEAKARLVVRTAEQKPMGQGASPAVAPGPVETSDEEQAELLMDREPASATAEPGASTQATTRLPSSDTEARSAGFEQTFAQRLVSMYREGRWFLLLPGFLLAGLLLNLTPCVYPIIAPTAGFIAKQSAHAVGGRVGFGVTFLVGAALVFGGLGTLFGATGQVFGAFYQQPWFTLTLGAVMILLALSMFDVYQIRLPEGLSSGLRGRTGLLGALAMGAFIGVAAVPCGGPVIAMTATLVFEAQDVPFGLAAFTTMGVGLGFPVAILIMTGALGVLAKPGEWMVTVKHLLGLAVLASGVYYLGFFLTPRIGEAGMAWVWAVYLIGSAVYLLVFDHTGRTQTGILALKSAFALGAAFYAAIALQPMWAKPAAGSATEQDLWQPMNLAAFEKALGSGQPVLVDFTADWCAKCKEIEAKTFSREAVRSVLSRMVAFRADGTHRTEQVISWERYFGVRSYPAVFVYDADGKLVSRFDTFVDEHEFLRAARLAGVR